MTIKEASGAQAQPPVTRRDEIVASAMTYFARHGLSGSTRELAKHLGVTQPALYKHFKSKDALLEAIILKLEEGQIAADWSRGLDDRRVPISDRLIDFFAGYATFTYTPDWIRLYMFVGLADGAMNLRHIAHVGNPLMRRVCVEVAADAGLERGIDEIGQDELDVVWLLHGGLFYFYIRKHVYGDMPARDLDFPLHEGVRQLLVGLREIYARMISSHGP